MFDGIKVLDLSVSADLLLLNNRLLFPLSLDEQTGAVLDRPRRANDQGLIFTLTPTLTGERVCCELQGSLHRYGRGGLHNADDFTAADLLAILDQLVSTYGINPFTSRLNNVEFGVNVSLPFSVGQVLDNLISYKYRPFTKEPGDGFSYYQAVTQRYVVKLYDKGDQYGLPGNVLRVEVKVLKMEYLTRRAVRLDTLADLLLTDNYGALGALLVDTFTEILFDEPTINPDALTIRERDIYQNGRNQRFWSIPDDLTGKEYDRCQKSFKRAEKTFRALLNRHRRGDDWQSLTAALIAQTWQRLSTVDDDLLTRISERRAAWADLTVNSNETATEPINNRELTGNSWSDAGRETVEKCPLLTNFDDDLLTGEMSGINPLSIVLIPDNEGSQTTDRSGGHGTPPAAPDNGDKTVMKCGPPAAASSALLNGQNTGQTVRPTRCCIVTGLDITHQPTRTRFVSTSSVRRLYDLDRQTFDTLAGRFLTARQAGADLDKQCYHIAHNIRNTHTNPHTNPVRPLKRYLSVLEGQTLPLFPPADTVRPTSRQLTALEHRRGTHWEIRL